MGSYLQMGHNTENLVGAEDLEGYAGIVLSPVNRTPDEFRKHIATFREKGTFDIVLDPQLYYPRSERGQLQEHPHFPTDFESADLGDMSWWSGLSEDLAGYCTSLGVTTVASPCYIPRTCSNEYYTATAEIADGLTETLKGKNTKTLTTVVVSTNELVDEKRPFEIASIVSGKKSDGYFLVFVSDREPRRELSDENELFGMMSLIRELKASGRPCLVSQCSSDMVLFKYAGADNCSTGNFFNLRRFTKSRYEEPKENGGGQLPYWFSQSLMAFIREADLLRLQRSGHEALLTDGHSGNHWGQDILEHLASTPEVAWVAKSWRHYLSWFVKAEGELSDDVSLASSWLKIAEKNWDTLEDEELLMDERRNDGSWVRSWRQSLIRFKRSDPAA